MFVCERGRSCDLTLILTLNSGGGLSGAWRRGHKITNHKPNPSRRRSPNPKQWA